MRHWLPRSLCPFPHFCVCESPEKHPEQARRLRVRNRNPVVSLVSDHRFSSNPNLSEQAWNPQALPPFPA